MELFSQLKQITRAFEKDTIPELEAGDLVRFQAYYESDQGGVGVIKEITVCEFKDPHSQLFVSLPCAIVVSTIPGEQWLDFVPLTHLEILTTDELLKEYADAFPEQTAIEMFTLHIGITDTIAQYRKFTGYSYLPAMPYRDPIIAFQGGVQ